MLEEAFIVIRWKGRLTNIASYRGRTQPGLQDQNILLLYLNHLRAWQDFSSCHQTPALGQPMTPDILLSSSDLWSCRQAGGAAEDGWTIPPADAQSWCWSHAGAADSAEPPQPLLKHSGLALCRNISDKSNLFPLETDN